MAQKGLSDHLYIGTQKEGDLVLIPPRWYHQVYSLENSFAIASQYANNINKFQIYKHILEWSSQGKGNREKTWLDQQMQKEELETSESFFQSLMTTSANIQKSSLQGSTKKQNSIKFDSKFFESFGVSNNSKSNLNDARNKPWVSSAWSALLDADDEEKKKNPFKYSNYVLSGMENESKSSKTNFNDVKEEKSLFTGATILPPLEKSIYKDLTPNKDAWCNKYLKRGGALNRFLYEESLKNRNIGEKYTDKVEVDIHDYLLETEVSRKHDKTKNKDGNIYNICFNVASIQKRVSIKEEVNQVLYNALISRYGYEEGEKRYKKLIK